MQYNTTQKKKSIDFLTSNKLLTVRCRGQWPDIRILYSVFPSKCQKIQRTMTLSVYNRCRPERPAGTEYDHDNFELFAQVIYRADRAADGSPFHSRNTGHFQNRPHHSFDFRGHKLARNSYMPLGCRFAAPALWFFRQKQPRTNLIYTAYSPFPDS